MKAKTCEKGKGTGRLISVGLVLLAPLVTLTGLSGPALAEDVQLQDPAKVVAEMTMTVHGGNEISAPVYVNGKGPFEFVVDTGATSSGIWNSVVQQNALENNHVETITVSAADGLVRLKILEFGSVRAAVFALDPAHLMEYPDYYSYYRRPLSGILGADYLTNHVVVFDFPRDMMVLYPKTTNLTRSMPGYFDSIPLRFEGEQKALFVKAGINGKRLNALVDTGASMTTILTSEHRRLGVSLEGAQQVTMTGVNGNPIRGYIVRLPALKAGSKVWRDVEVVFAQFTVGRADRFSMLLGMDLMGQTPFAIDYGRKRLLLAKPEKVNMVSRRDPRAQALVEAPEELQCSFPAAAREGLPCVAATRPPERR